MSDTEKKPATISPADRDALALRAGEIVHDLAKQIGAEIKPSSERDRGVGFFNESAGGNLTITYRSEETVRGPMLESMLHVFLKAKGINPTARMDDYKDIQGSSGQSIDIPNGQSEQAEAMVKRLIENGDTGLKGERLKAAKNAPYPTLLNEVIETEKLARTAFLDYQKNPNDKTSDVVRKLQTRQDEINETLNNLNPVDKPLTPENLKQSVSVADPLEGAKTRYANMSEEQRVQEYERLERKIYTDAAILEQGEKLFTPKEERFMKVHEQHLEAQNAASQPSPDAHINQKGERASGLIGMGFAAKQLFDNVMTGDAPGAIIAGTDLLVNAAQALLPVAKNAASVAEEVIEKAGPVINTIKNAAPVVREVAKKAGPVITVIDGSYNVYKAPNGEKLDAAAKTGFSAAGAFGAVAAIPLVVATAPVTVPTALITAGIGMAGASIGSNGYEIGKAGIEIAAISVNESGRFKADLSDASKTNPTKAVRYVTYAQHRLNDDLQKKGVKFDENGLMDLGNFKNLEAMHEVLTTKRDDLYWKTFIPFNGGAKSDYAMFDAALKELEPLMKKTITPKKTEAPKAEKQQPAERKVSELSSPEFEKIKMQVAAAQPNKEIGKAVHADTTSAPTVGTGQQNSHSIV